MLARKIITPARREGAEIAAWAAVHGFAVLVIDGPLRTSSEQDRDQLLEVVLRVVHSGV